MRILALVVAAKAPNLRCFLLTVLVALLPGFVLAAEPYVLLLASYHPGFAWTDGQVAGFRETLARASPEMRIRVEYLDTKNESPTRQHFAAVTALLHAKYRNTPPLLVAAQDDDALDLALTIRRPGGIFPGVPIVFSGVSAQRGSTLANEPRITGVFDDVDIAANVGLLTKILPGLKRIYFIHDQSRTGLAQAENVKSWQNRFPGLRFEFLTDMTVREIEKKLAALDQTSAVIALAFNRDRTGRILDHEEAATIWGKASTVPVLVKEDAMMTSGVLGGIMLTGYREGSAAASLAQRIIDGSDAKSLPMIGGAVEPVFSDEALRRFGIPDSALPVGAKILHRKQPLHVTHPVEFWVTVVLLGSSVIIIIVLVLLSRRERRARQDAVASERNYREILNASNEAIVIHELSGRIVDVNTRFHTLFGLDPDAGLPEDVTNLSTNEPPYSAREADQWMRRAVEEGPQLFEWRARRSDGSQFWVEVALCTATISGNPRILAAIRDITSRKKTEAALQESEQRFGLLLQNSPVGIVYVQKDWRLSYCNDRFVSLIGAPREKIIGTDMKRLRDSAIEPALKQALGGTSASYEGPYLSTASGKNLMIDFRAAPMRDNSGDVVGCIAMMEDISLRFEAERILREFNETLEQGIAERTAALTRANADLKRAMHELAQSEKLAALGNLVAGVAHELNTPIGNARMIASTIEELTTTIATDISGGNIRRSALDAYTEKCTHAAQMLDHNLDRAATLIHNFKQVAVDQSSMRRRAFNLREVVDSTVEMLRPRISRSNCLLMIDMPGNIEIDGYPGALEQILMNFIVNSLVHGFSDNIGGKIQISAATSRAPHHVRLTYTDDGRGMPPEVIEKAFDPFFTTALGKGGSGLGLYIAYNLTTSILGGNIHLDSRPGRGVSIELDLPISSPTQAPPTFSTNH